jgi:hypothetical protein
MMKKILSSIILFGSFASVGAQTPKYSNEFLSIGVGARAMGMSGAVVASDDDATSALWNPAGLSRIQGDIQLAAMHAELFAGISKFDYATLATHIDSSRTIGFSIVRFGTDDIPNTLDLIDASGVIDYNRLSSFSIADYAFVFSYSKQTKTPGLRLGGNAKIIHRIAGDFGKAWGFGFDLGAQYSYAGWQFGANVKDVTSTFNAWSYNTDLLESTFSKTGNEIPKNTTEITLPKMILGAAYRFNPGKKITLLAEVNADVTFDGQRNTLISSAMTSIDPHIGIEMGYSNLVFLRGGVQNIQQVKNMDGSTSTILQPNIGVGLKLGKLSIDYALTNIGSQQILYSNVFSLRLEITKRKKNS